MPATTPITQRDVAQACGLHPSTVCLALKNSPSIPEATRRRIHQVAEELGYCPNVAARNLALLRGERKSAALLPLAWVNQERRRDHWKSDPEARVYFEAARRRAAEAGYHLEEVWTREPGMTAPRLIQILQARGVEGVMFPAHRSFDFALLGHGWDAFAMVGFNDHRLAEWVDAVCPDYYRNANLALRRLSQLGFSQPGLVASAHFDAASNGLVRSAFLRHQADQPESSRVPVCFCAEDEAGEALVAWAAAYQPDVVLCPEYEWCEIGRAALPELEWIQLGAVNAMGETCVDAGAGEIAAAAVDALVEKVRRFERGFRGTTRLQTIGGTWQDGAPAARRLESVVA